LLVFEPDPGDSDRLLGADFRKVNRESLQQFRFGSEGLLSYINGFYRLNVRLPEPVDKPFSWKIELLDESGHRDKHLQAIYPQRLAPCQNSSSVPRVDNLLTTP
jgi:hypothetical protein